MNWDQIEDVISSRDVREVESAYTRWIEANKLEDYISEAIDDWVNGNLTEHHEDYRKESQHEFEVFKSTCLGDATGDEYANFSHQDWVELWIEEEVEEEFNEWIYDIASQEDVVYRDATSAAKDEYSIMDFALEEHGSMGDLLAELSIEIPSGGGLEEVSLRVESWARRGSMTSEVHSGDYHNGPSVGQDHWRVEKDSSIDDLDGATAAEIISPVYDSPNQMLAELKSLLEFMSEEKAIANESTGLHVTMSWVSDNPVTPNHLKMTLLLGDLYLLKEFGREFNRYTHSQQSRIKSYADKLIFDVTDQTSLVALERELSKGISTDKFNSINFKSLRNDSQNPLIEFRIAGHTEYAANFRKVEKTVARYAAAMEAGHDRTAYVKDYARALLRAIGVGPANEKPTNTGPASELRYAVADRPVTQVMLQLVSKKNHAELLDYLSSAYRALDSASAMRVHAKQRELFTEDTGPQDDSNWMDVYKKAQAELGAVLALIIKDMIEQRNKIPVTANTALAMRKVLREFGMGQSEAWASVQASHTYQESSLDPFDRELRFGRALSLLLRTPAAEPRGPLFTIEYAWDQSIYVSSRIHDDPELPVKPADFRVVDNFEISAIKRTVDDAVSTMSRIEEAKETLERQLAAQERPGQQPMDTVSSTELLTRLDRRLSAYLLLIEEFRTKFGFLPNGFSNTSKSLGYEEFTFLNQEARQKMTATHWIKFVQLAL